MSPHPHSQLMTNLGISSNQGDHPPTAVFVTTSLYPPVMSIAFASPDELPILHTRTAPLFVVCVIQSIRQKRVLRTKLFPTLDNVLSHPSSNELCDDCWGDINDDDILLPGIAKLDSQLLGNPNLLN